MGYQLAGHHWPQHFISAKADTRTKTVAQNFYATGQLYKQHMPHQLGQRWVTLIVEHNPG